MAPFLPYYGAKWQSHVTEVVATSWRSSEVWRLSIRRILADQRKLKSADISSVCGAFFALTGITAGFFSVVSILGYVDAGISLLAIDSPLLRPAMAASRPSGHGLLLTLVAGILLWANLRPTGWQGEFGIDTPTGLDPITEAMFWRGWPLSPWMLCLIHSMKLHPDGCRGFWCSMVPFL